MQNQRQANLPGAGRCYGGRVSIEDSGPLLDSGNDYPVSAYL